MIGIWGSCVTRDTFALGGAWEGTLSYHARSSWIAQASPVADLPPTEVPDGPGFGHRMVREDLEKSILAETAQDAPQLVIFDLIDERFDIVTVGDAHYTVNDYYDRLDLEDPLRQAAAETVAFRDDARDSMFAEAAAVLAPQWLETLPTTRFALHQAWYTARAADPAYRFYDSAPAHVAWSNRRLGAHYAALREVFGDRLHIIEPERRAHLVADPHHKWGLAHFHYVPSYYADALAQVEAIASGPMRARPQPLTIPSSLESGAAGDPPRPRGRTVHPVIAARSMARSVWRSAPLPARARAAVRHVAGRAGRASTTD